MKFLETPISGVYIVEPETHGDERGFFARSYCEKEFSNLGLTVPAVQCNISYNENKQKRNWFGVRVDALWM